MLADELDYVLGVDTRRDEHVMAVMTAPVGAIVTAPERLRQDRCRFPAGGTLRDRCSRFRRTSSAGADEAAVRIVLRSLARRVYAATVEADELEREILTHVRAHSRRRCSASLASGRLTPPN